MADAVVRLGRGPAMELLPEPDWWSAVQAHMPSARRRFEALEPLQRSVRSAAVILLARTGRPVPPQEIAAEVGAPLAEVAAALAELERRLFFLVRNGAGEVSWAFPFSAVATPHRLAFPSGERRHGA